LEGVFSGRNLQNLKIRGPLSHFGGRGGMFSFLGRKEGSKEPKKAFFLIYGKKTRPPALIVGEGALLIFWEDHQKGKSREGGRKGYSPKLDGRRVSGGRGKSSRTSR